MARLLGLLAAVLIVASCLAAPAAGGIEAIFNFGDSISDTGNLAREGRVTGMEPIKHLPYGMTINEPTGRCSDGHLMIDFLAKDLGLPLLNPYLDKSADFTHGVNFAVAGATALSSSSLAKSGIVNPYTDSSLEVQLGWFKEFVKDKSPQEVRDMLSRSLVLVGEIGGNDYNYDFLMNGQGGGDLALTIAKMNDIVPEVVQAIKNTAEELLAMGTKRMIIPGNFPIGCMPSYLSMMSGDPDAVYGPDKCLVVLNMFAQAHNAKLQEAIKELRRSYPAATIAYADYFGAYMQMLSMPSALGFDEASTRRACCGAAAEEYGFDMGSMCGTPGAAVCANPGAYMSWDGIHLTQHAYGAMADLLYHQGFASPQPF